MNVEFFFEIIYLNQLNHISLFLMINSFLFENRHYISFFFYKYSLPKHLTVSRIYDKQDEGKRVLLPLGE
jgi:hypothetical protein